MRRHVSRAKKILVEDLKMPSERFEHYIRCSNIPQSLVATFGRGGLFLLPTTETAYVYSFTFI